MPFLQRLSFIFEAKGMHKQMDAQKHLLQCQPQEGGGSQKVSTNLTGSPKVALTQAG